MTATDQTIDTLPDGALTAELARRQADREAHAAAEDGRLKSAQAAYDDDVLARAPELKATAEAEFAEHYKAMEAAAQAGDIVTAYAEAHATMAARAYRSSIINAASSAANRHGVPCPIPTSDRPVDIDVRGMLNMALARGSSRAGDDRFADVVGHYPLDLADLDDGQED
jgi:hypothetical protein